MTSSRSPLSPSPSAAPQELTVVVGMSGGVDSSVAALLLKQQGYRVIGLFMKNWDETDANGQCSAAQDYEDVARVCETLDIPFYSIEFIQEYWDHVFADFLKGYEAGYTPNPDILCNREIKFELFFKKALELGADYLATGHYCQRQPDPLTGEVQLLRGVDAGKDQTYFLYTLPSEKLQRVLFPIGHLPKTEVRALAKAHDLITHEKKDSTGICFIGERKFRAFLSQYLAARPGPIVNLAGQVIGEHQGAAYYTLGQRKGLQIGGQGEPWFVVQKRVKDNTLVAVQGSEHPALFARTLEAVDPYWVSPQWREHLQASSEPVRWNCTAKSRYRQIDTPCSVEWQPQTQRLQVTFETPQRALTPGQAFVLYSGPQCLGGATIDCIGPSLWEESTGVVPRGLTPDLAPASEADLRRRALAMASR
jgi:tRNA-specific 2-thiouridylase